MTFSILENSNRDDFVEQAKSFCFEFCNSIIQPKYILGRNIYAENVAKYVKVNGFIDDYSSDSEYLGFPVIKMTDVPKEALVLNVAGGRPLSARKKLNQAGFRNIDYFSFYKFSGFPLIEARFNEGFSEEFNSNIVHYHWIYNLLHDEESREVFNKLVSFRLEYDIAHLEGFTWKEDRQYFEDFLQLKAKSETFVDVGAFDGLTSLEFIKRCPQFQAIHIFEPEPSNFDVCITKLSGLGNIKFHQLGLSNTKATLNFDVNASGSKVVADGAMTINVERLDDVITEPVTFIKIDIEGFESAALAGASDTILKYHPRLAVAVYHQAGDFWKIPRQVLAIRNDYNIYLRHYTESIYETVMFFCACIMSAIMARWMQTIYYACY